MVMVFCSGSVLFSSPVHIRESPKFFFLMSQDLSKPVPLFAAALAGFLLHSSSWLAPPGTLPLPTWPATTLKMRWALAHCGLVDDWCPYWETADHLAALTHVFPWDQRKLFNVLNVGESSWLSRPSLAFTVGIDKLDLHGGVSMVIDSGREGIPQVLA